MVQTPQKERASVHIAPLRDQVYDLLAPRAEQILETKLETKDVSIKDQSYKGT